MKSVPSHSLLALGLGAFLVCETASQSPETKHVPSAHEVARGLNEAFVGVAERVSRSVAVIEVAQRPDATSLSRENPFWDLLPPELRKQFEEELEKGQRERPQTPDPRFGGRGSGLVIRKEGYILTNSHVVEGAERIRVRFKDGNDYEATEVWADPQSDIAVIKVAADDLVEAKLGDSSKVRVGEMAIAIGAPFVLEYSVTFGHISAKGRGHVVPAWGANSLGARMDQDFLQTDASINPGNSGGPLLNVAGEVIGINTLIRGLGTGIGFAVPINRAKDVADSLIRDGKVERAWLGIRTETFRESDLREIVGGVKDGLVVSRIEPDGPASRSELRPADIITGVEGMPVATVQELRDAIRRKRAGTKIGVDVVRFAGPGRAENVTVQVQTEVWEQEEPSTLQKPRAEPSMVLENLGWSLQPLTAELAGKYEAGVQAGVVVTEVKPESVAALKGFRPGHVITAVDRKAVTNPEELREALRRGGVEGALVELISAGAPEYRVLKLRKE